MKPWGWSTKDVIGRRVVSSLLVGFRSIGIMEKEPLIWVKVVMRFLPIKEKVNVMPF